MSSPSPLRPGLVRRQRKAVTLTELLCVMAIIMILFALYLPAVVRALVRARKFLSQF